VTAILCEGRSSDLPFLVGIFESLLGCVKQPKGTPFPLATGPNWTILKTPTGRLVGINAATSYEKVLDAIPATATKAVENGISLGIVVDLDDKTLEDRSAAVRARLQASTVGSPAPDLVLVGIGLDSTVVQVAADRDLDQVVAEIVLTAHPELGSVLTAAIESLSRISRKPTWKFATCMLAAAVGREDAPEAIYHHAARGLKDQARSVLTKAGLLGPLESLVK
jgi:hypothetical protein